MRAYGLYMPLIRSPPELMSLSVLSLTGSCLSICGLMTEAVMPCLSIYESMNRMSLRCSSVRIWISAPAQSEVRISWDEIAKLNGVTLISISSAVAPTSSCLTIAFVNDQ